MLKLFQEKEDEYLWIQEILIEQELIVDGTKETIYRLYPDDKQKKYYSGKEKNYFKKKKTNIYGYKKF